MAFRC